MAMSIFVHAGAGFHSHQTEAQHLQACRTASLLAMAVLKSGGTAVDAVETAIKSLEDNDITNAAYGSNLTLKGTVECDATIVDHLGRSGAVGAVEHIKNPISLARLILDASVRPLSLNRVPPNFLVSSAATQFASEHGLPVLHPDALVAPASGERYIRWKHELMAVEQAEKEKLAAMTTIGYPGCVHCEAALGSRNASPPECTSNHAQWPGPEQTAAAVAGLQHNHSPIHARGAAGMTNNAAGGDRNIPAHVYPCPRCHPPLDMRFVNDGGEDAVDVGMRMELDEEEEDKEAVRYDLDIDGNDDRHARGGDAASSSSSFLKRQREQEPSPSPKHASDNDRITDTVGAIAIDSYGHIAAGSSSGGIGMKHPGRVGPAALVGIGTAVAPAQEDDEDGKCVAVVTSGTGEHMATAVVARGCAERVYDGVRRRRNRAGDKGKEKKDDEDAMEATPVGARCFEECTEDEAVESVIRDEFMNHPGVKGSSCHAGIGLMAVKKEKYGVGFYFGHNTESFALASMNSSDREPHCLMSRTDARAGKIAQGGRLISCRANRSRKHVDRGVGKPMRAIKGIIPGGIKRTRQQVNGGVGRHGDGAIAGDDKGKGKEEPSGSPIPLSTSPNELISPMGRIVRRLTLSRKNGSVKGKGKEEGKG